jgi:DNA-directed RNA polymerase sigma subunit (sigma70/sigma32)
MPDPDAAIDVPTLLARLSPRERDVVEKCFGLSSGEAWKVTRLAERHQTSCDGVRKVLERALATLRRLVRIGD